VNREDVQVFRWGRFRIGYRHRAPDTPLGRFGGGWQWEVGVQVGRSSAIVNLLVAALRIDWRYRG
jgi:hypothetical protein